MRSSGATSVGLSEGVGSGVSGAAGRGLSSATGVFDATGVSGAAGGIGAGREAAWLGTVLASWGALLPMPR